MNTRKFIALTIAVSIISLFIPRLSDTRQVGAISRAAPLLFIENVGQLDARTRFQVRDSNTIVHLTADALWFTLLAPTPDAAAPRGVNLKLSFVGANPQPQLEPIDRLATRVSSFVGADPAQWQTDVPVWRGVRYRELYPGLDLELTGAAGRLMPRLVINDAQVGYAALAQVQMRVEGAAALAVADASLLLTTALGDFTLPLLPVATAAGVPANLRGLSAAVRGTTVAAPFAPNISAAAVPLAQETIYGLAYSFFLGGDSYDFGYSLTIDEASNTYVTGFTASVNFPITAGAFDTDCYGDIFVAKMNDDGTNLIYATFVGGDDMDWGNAIAVDSSGNAYVTGRTYSEDFPTTPGAFAPNYNGYNDYSPPLCSFISHLGKDAFVFKLNPDGTNLIYSSFLGGSFTESGFSIAVDDAGSAYVTGGTTSWDFPTTANAFDVSYDSGDAFVVKVSSDGTRLDYATLLGGAREDQGFALAVDRAGNAYIAGATSSFDFPVTSDAFDPTCGTDGQCNYNGQCYLIDTFIAKLNSTGTGLHYATYLGGSAEDIAYCVEHSRYGIAVDSGGSVYVAGGTHSIDFPVTAGAIDISHDGYANGYPAPFVTKMDATGSSAVYSTFLSGSHRGGCSTGIAVDPVGRAYVTGRVDSIDFPTTENALDRTCGTDGNCDYYGGYYYPDAFVVKLNASGTRLDYATYLGGSDEDISYGIAVDGRDAIYLTGRTRSADFPVTTGAFDTSHNGGLWDAFVTKLVVITPIPTTIPSPGWTPSPIILPGTPVPTQTPASVVQPRTEPAEVPESGAILLLGSGLLVLIGYFRAATRTRN